MGRLKAALKKEFLQFLRDRMLIILILWTYTVEVVVCTVALSFDVRNLTLALHDQDRTQLSRELAERFTATEYFGRMLPVASPGEIDRLLDRGEADLALVVPPDFSRRALAGEPAEVQVVLSGVNSNTANTARGYANVIIERFAHDLLRSHAAAHGYPPMLPEVSAQTRIWYNPELRFQHFMVISMIVIAALMVGIITTAAGLVREKESGTAEQLMVTPLRRHEIVIAKMAPPLAVGLAALVPSIAIALAFGVPLRGSVTLFVLASAVTLVVCMAIGVFISTFAANLQQALLISFFVLFPVMFLSGTVVPVESMPQALQVISLASPIRYYMEIALGIFLKGVGWSVLWPQFLALAAIGMALAGWGLLRLKTRLYA
ncbi:MAG: ABC transporter permease [Betaproteobacteria bacterium]|nr:ABC transporter permease [Betaproteobacteria bacterium]